MSPVSSDTASLVNQTAPSAALVYYKIRNGKMGNAEMKKQGNSPEMVNYCSNIHVHTRIIQLHAYKPRIIATNYTKLFCNIQVNSVIICRSLKLWKALPDRSTDTPVGCSIELHQDFISYMYVYRIMNWFNFGAYNGFTCCLALCEIFSPSTSGVSGVK